MTILGVFRRQLSAGYKRRGIYSRSLDRLNRLPLHSAYLARHSGTAVHPTREALWKALSEQCTGPIDYLEFGVHHGHSIATWAAMRPEPTSRFTGFDTFAGLPETWNHFYPEGHFDTGGLTPQTEDPRVQFVTGLFQDTLTPFLSCFDPAGRTLVVHIDSDLYSSALYVLVKLDPLLVAGSLIVLDEFGDVLHEFRAWQDYLGSHYRTATPVGFHDEGFTAALMMR